MSFSSDVKQELNKPANLANKEIIKYELIGYLISGNTSIVETKNIRFSTESDYNINRFSKILTNLNINHNIEVIGNNFVIIFNKKQVEENFENIEKSLYLKKEMQTQILENINKNKSELIKAFIRGIFMGAGSINNPQNKYHLEIAFSNNQNLQFSYKILEQLGIKFKKLKTQNKEILYMKEGEEISQFLAFIGASKAVLKFEDIRIQREMRGKVNRLVNCETANLNKTINASIEQIEAINKLKQNGKFNKLDKNLKEMAIVRLENPNLSLIELGKLLKKPIGKSGVNYRLKKIMEIANE